MAIDLSFEAHQLDLQRTARGLFASRCPRAAVRRLEGDPVGYQPDLWREMAGLGWLGLNSPEVYGGSEGGFLDLYVLYEEFGRALVPSPHLDTVAVAGDLLLNAGTEDQKLRLLPEIAAGRCIVATAAVEASGAFDPSGTATTASPQGDGSYSVSGQKVLVAYAEAADRYLVMARTGSGSGGITLVLVDARAPGIVLERLANIASVPLYAVRFDGVQVPADAIIGQPGWGWEPFAASVTKAAVLQTASIVGAAREVLQMTNQYAKDRQQFGASIGSYQAVQYLVSDILIDLHTVEMLGAQAAYRISAGLPFAREAAMAVAHGKRQAAHLHRQAHEVHAGIGFMQEYDLQLFSRRSKYWEYNLGDAAYYYEQVARAMAL